VLPMTVLLGRELVVAVSGNVVVTHLFAWMEEKIKFWDCVQIR